MLQPYVIEFGQFAGEVAPRLHLNRLPPTAEVEQESGFVLFVHDEEGRSHGNRIQEALTVYQRPTLVIWICKDVVPTPQSWFSVARGLQLWAPAKLYTGLAAEWRIYDGRIVENSPGAAIWYDRPQHNLADFYKEVQQRGQRVVPGGSSGGSSGGSYGD